MTHNIILASQSPRRKELLSQLGIKFKTVSSNYEEDMTLNMKPLQLAKFLSRGKAMAVSQKYTKHLIISADTFVVLKDKLLGKPLKVTEAKRMLRQISGQKLLVITGYTIIDTKHKKQLSKAVETNVFIKKLDNQEINRYVKTGEPLDKAGAFGVQGLGALIIKKIEGDYTNVIGLPLYSLAQSLKIFGLIIL